MKNKYYLPKYNIIFEIITNVNIAINLLLPFPGGFMLHPETIQKEIDSGNLIPFNELLELLYDS